jgi:acyl-CoA synthetase (AMP-forming)/AMP-acid ligase II
MDIAGCHQVLCAREHAALFGGYKVHVIDEIPPTALDIADFPAVAAELPGRLAFTSGTTGLPKAIVYSQHARYLANTLLQACLPWLPGPDSRVLLMTPFAHGASLQSAAWLDQGGQIVLMDGVQIDRIAPMLGNAELEAIFAAPTVLAKLTATFAGERFSGVRTIFTGTAPLPPLLYEKVRAMFGPVVRLTYGKSEVFNPITILPPADSDAYYADGGATDGSCCVGWPAPGVELAIEDDEILIRAQHMSDGWIDAAGFHPWRADGFHPTGDVGRIDEQGRLHLAARLSDAMKSGGYKIYPQEIERALAQAGDITIIGFPSDYWGEIITAVAESPSPDWEKSAKSACASLAPFKHPRFFVALERIPRNGMGKIVRRQIVAAIAQSHRLTDGPRPALEKLP